MVGGGGGGDMTIATRLSLTPAWCCERVANDCILVLSPHQRVNTILTSAHLPRTCMCPHKQARASPGPGAYTFNLRERRGGGKFNSSRPKSDLEWAMLRAKSQPGPGEYKITSAQPATGEDILSKQKLVIFESTHLISKKK